MAENRLEKRHNFGEWLERASRNHPQRNKRSKKISMMTYHIREKEPRKIRSMK